MGEFVVYNAALSSSDVTLLNSFLANEWAPVPEPSVVALLGLGEFLLWRRRRM